MGGAGDQVHIHGEQLAAGHQRNADRIQQREQHEQGNHHIQGHQHAGFDPAAAQRGSTHPAMQRGQLLFGILAPAQHAAHRGLLIHRHIHLILDSLLFHFEHDQCQRHDDQEQDDGLGGALPNL